MRDSDLPVPLPVRNDSPFQPWVNNHLKACKDHNHSGLCPIKEQYANRKPATPETK